MVEGDPGHRLCVIVVRELREQVVAEVTRVAADYEVDVTLCDDVYGAVVVLARSTGSCALTVGRLRELARENGRFFRVAARNGARCCAWLDEDDPAERNVVLSVVRAGASVIDRIEEIGGVVENWLARTGCHGDGTGATDQQWRASEAELNALLGQEADG
jgi:hypothetical protein